jgi:hypothetical protein
MTETRLSLSLAERKPPIREDLSRKAVVRHVARQLRLKRLRAGKVLVCTLTDL